MVRMDTVSSCVCGIEECPTADVKDGAGVTKVVSQSLAGFLLQKELDYLDGAVKEPKRPFAAIVGGSKVN